MAKAMTSATQVTRMERMNGRMMKSPTWGNRGEEEVMVIVMVMW